MGIETSNQIKKKQESLDFAFGKSFNTAGSLSFDDWREETK